jgi:hypothetical protein
MWRVAQAGVKATVTEGNDAVHRRLRLFVVLINHS